MATITPVEDLNKSHTSIRDWLKDDQPREKMIRFGASALSPAELLALLINNGTRSKSALELSQDLLVRNHNSLNNLARNSLKDLQKLKGIGPAKAVVIKAAMELAIKKEAETIMRTEIATHMDVVAYLQKKLQHEHREHLIVIYLNQRNRVICHETVSTGGISGTVVDPRVVIRRALEEHASSLVLCHNHPSGNTRPSQQDIDVTKKIKQAAKLFDIGILDHLIVSDEGHYSLRENGEM